MITRLMRNEGVSGLLWRVKTLSSGFFVAPLLASCVQGSDVSHPNNSPTDGSPYTEMAQAELPTRLILTFNRSVPFSSDGFLLDMQSQTLARFSYLGSISIAAHVYEIQPLRGQTVGQVLQNLTRLPVVQRVEVDQRMKIHQ